ncbi:hypothetical protein BDY21DRAFT_422130, partial [Lineolata rhizophorae]
TGVERAAGTLAAPEIAAEGGFLASRAGPVRLARANWPRRAALFLHSLRLVRLAGTAALSASCSVRTARPSLTRLFDQRPRRFLSGHPPTRDQHLRLFTIPVTRWTPWRLHARPARRPSSIPSRTPVTPLSPARLSRAATPLPPAKPGPLAPFDTTSNRHPSLPSPLEQP